MGHSRLDGKGRAVPKSTDKFRIARFCVLCAALCAGFLFDSLCCSVDTVFYHTTIDRTIDTQTDRWTRWTDDFAVAIAALQYN